MSEYKGIKGFQVQTRTEDPTPYAQALADNPYGGTWASGGALNTGRQRLGASGQAHSGSIGFGGASSPTNFDNKTETYDGSSWTEVNDLNTARHAMGTASQGTSTATLAFTGNTSPGNSNAVESWDGTNWTEVAETATSRRYASGFGTQTAAVLAAGYTTTNIDNVELWDGSSWSEIAEINTGRNDCQGAIGISTSGMIIGGTPGGVPVAICEYWNGSSWTEVADLNTGRGTGGSGGVFTSGITFGGETPNTTKTESWNGSAWTETSDMATQRNTLGGSGSSNSVALAFGGDDPSNPKTGITEEWAFTGLDPSTTPAADYSDALIGDFYYNSSEGKFKNTVSGSGTGTWASGANMNTARYRMQGGMGTYNAAFAVAGATPNKANVENYNGSSWTEVNDYPTGAADVAAGGTATAGITVGGNPNLSQTLEWDGTSFSSGGAVPVALARSGTFGTQTALVAVGGASPSRSPSDQSTETLHYDGSSWTDVADYPTILANGGGSGVQTAGIIGGGYTPADPPNNKSNTYNGSAWTEAPDMNNTHQEHGFAQRSPNSATLNYGDAPSGVNTEEWNGTSWTETNNLSTGRSAGGSAGDLNNALYFGGSSPALSPTTTNVTEEWSQSDFLNKLVTSS